MADATEDAHGAGVEVMPEGSGIEAEAAQEQVLVLEDVDMGGDGEAGTQDTIAADADGELGVNGDADADAGVQAEAHADYSGLADADADADAAPGGGGGVVPVVVPEVRIPAKKDASLREFVGKMDEYAPIIPDAVTNYYLTLAGLPPPPATPLPLARLLALATQKFVADIAADAYQYSRIRSSNTTSNNPLGGLGGVAAAGLPPPGGVLAPAKDAPGKGNLGMQRPGFGGGGQGGGQGRTVLTMEDLGMAVAEYGVNVKRGEFYR